MEVAEVRSATWDTWSCRAREEGCIQRLWEGSGPAESLKVWRRSLGICSGLVLCVDLLGWTHIPTHCILPMSKLFGYPTLISFALLFPIFLGRFILLIEFRQWVRNILQLDSRAFIAKRKGVYMHRADKARELDLLKLRVDEFANGICEGIARGTSGETVPVYVYGHYIFMT